MADRFYSVILGEGLSFQVTEAASTTSEAIELRVSDSIYSDRLSVINGVEAIENYLKTTETTPIA